jgi:dynein heavy chain
MGVELSMDDGFTMQDLLDMGVAKHVEKVQEIALVANKQFSLEKGLETMRKEWANMSFTLVPYKNTGTYIVRAVDEISTLCDEHLVKTQSILSSPFVSHIEKSCKVWESKLLDATNLIEIWMTVQRAFMYLEPIFGSEDIMRQMPAEGKKFATVDQLWKRTLSQIHTYPRVMECVENPALAQTFESAAVKLDEIQKGLNAYLEMKRLAFPRFFFLSNDELLEILAETKDPTRVQPHLNKSFEGIASIDFQKASKETSADASRMQAEDVVITAMISAEGEKVPFVNIVDPCSGSRRGNVETWMNDVENAMKASVKDHTQRALYDYAFALAASNGSSLTALKGRSKSRDEWVLSWPGQVVLAVDQIFWTHGVEGALKDAENTNGASMRNYLQTLNNQLAGIVTLVRGKLSPLQRMTLSALTTVDVHARDVVTHMVQQNVRKLDAFEWFSQLRYYWQGDPSWAGSDGDTSANTNKPKAGGEDAGEADPKAKSKAMPTGGGKKAAANSAAAQLAAMGLGMATQQPSVMKEDPPRMPVRILNAVNPYAWEYLGNSARLVITPLTDRCYRTLIGAIHLMYGGAPAGPAGTGKTETTKDLAKAMAIQCVVFNCSDGLDYLAMAKFFKGLASAGAWSCFDEFNRIELEVRESFQCTYFYVLLYMYSACVGAVCDRSANPNHSEGQA